MHNTLFLCITALAVEKGKQLKLLIVETFWFCLTGGFLLLRQVATLMCNNRSTWASLLRFELPSYPHLAPFAKWCSGIITGKAGGNCERLLIGGERWLSLWPSGMHLCHKMGIQRNQPYLPAAAAGSKYTDFCSVGKVFVNTVTPVECAVNCQGSV